MYELRLHPLHIIDALLSDKYHAPRTLVHRHPPGIGPTMASRNVAMLSLEAARVGSDAAQDKAQQLGIGSTRTVAFSTIQDQSRVILLMQKRRYQHRLRR